MYQPSLSRVKGRPPEHSCQRLQARDWFRLAVFALC